MAADWQVGRGRDGVAFAATASSPHALKVMTVTAAVLFPVVPAYQAWTYHVFRSRIGGPATAAVAPPDPDQTARQATTPEA
jgi:hypothetical protein